MAALRSCTEAPSGTDTTKVLSADLTISCISKTSGCSESIQDEQTAEDNRVKYKAEAIYYFVTVPSILIPNWSTHPGHPFHEVRSIHLFVRLSENFQSIRPSVHFTLKLRRFDQRASLTARPSNLGEDGIIKAVKSVVYIYQSLRAYIIIFYSISAANRTFSTSAI
jgi:hypothetical protein